MNTEILEKDHRLKYFYLLDSDFILQKIKASEEYTSYTRKKLPISELFNVIFTHILSGAKEYVEFVFYPDLFRRTIWGEPIQSSNLTGLSLLAGVTIRNHCILQGFFNTLAREENAIKRIKLSGANEALIKKGFFQTNEFQDKNNLEKETTIYQKYNAIMKRFKDNPDYYSSEGVINFVSLNFMPWWIFTHPKYPESQYL